MITAFSGCDEYVAKWVQAHTKNAPGWTENYTTIGVLDGRRLICGVVYSNYYRHSIEASIASVDPRWANRRTLRFLFAYPFLQLGVERLQTTVAKKNKHARKFNERLGFAFEGKARKAWPDGSDACVYSMLREECKWIKGRNANVKRRLKRATPA